ncbi:7396_t:CDS:2 [Diversispora eburnea]|uniref:7396_t:CDS:1 n=1 Tax=Diversispora eburnea TaxID=1213867 RepID=A0A9N8YVP9_9GLOM|nr:7396_t:CDS:2 [Diversispora eburnea]
MPAPDTHDEYYELNDNEESEQVDEAGLLPLMLQAQDMIAKLESRVLELENDLETINEAHEQERDQLLQEIGEKDECIHSLKTKASRLEFGAREAIIVLARTYQIMSKLFKKVNRGYEKHPPSPSPTPINTNNVRRDSKLQSPNGDDDSDHKVNLTSTQQNNIHNETEHDESHFNFHNEIERNDNEAQNSENNENNNRPRRESFSSSRISLDDIPDLDEYGLDGSEDIADFAMSDEEDNEFESEFRSQQRKAIDNETERGDDETDHEDDIHHNIRDHLPSPGPVPEISHANLCPNCNTLLSQVDQHIEERAYLKRDLSALAVSLSEEQNLRAQIQSNKESLEQEIDEWINAMFEKVNQMVFDEANAREELELLNIETKGKMENPLKSSGSRQDRLRELKLLLVHLDSTKQRQAAPTQNGVPLSRNSVIRRSLMSNSPRSSRTYGNFGHMSPSIFSNNSLDEIIFVKNKRIYIDGFVFEEFQDYVKSLATTPAPNNSTPTHPFIKRCMTEDIQPCLFEGSNGWKSPFYKRRLLDAIIKNQCEIETIFVGDSNSLHSTQNDSQISSSISNTRSSYQDPPKPAPTIKCGLCGHLRSCEYRMRLSGPDAAVPPTTIMTPSSRFSIGGSPGWIPLDRFCRDRVVAVCDFYAYLSHLRQGLLINSPVWAMYKQCLKNRRKMSLARVGNVSMFEDEENINNEYLNNSEIEGMVVVVH